MERELKDYVGGDFFSKQRHLLFPLMYGNWYNVPDRWHIVALELVKSNIERKESEKFIFYFKGEPSEFAFLEIYFSMKQKMIQAHIGAGVILNAEQLPEEKIIGFSEVEQTTVLANLLGNGIRELSYEKESNRINISLSGKGEMPIFMFVFRGELNENHEEGFCMSWYYTM